MRQINSEPSIGDRQHYLSGIGKLLQTDYPGNEIVQIVCHGHSVPAGYFKTPEVRSLDSYPHLLRAGLAERYPHAVINVIVTGIGGEESSQGAKRFERDVLSLRPHLVTIDFGLGDRSIGLERSRAAWSAMIKAALAAHAKVLLLTPTADLGANLDDPKDPLNQHAEQIRELAREYHAGLVDSLAAFKQFGQSGGHIPSLMSQDNHPNRQGHELVARELLAWFP